VYSVAGLATTGAQGSNRAVQIQRQAGQTSLTAIQFGCPLDSDEIALMRNSLVNFSFVYATGTNFSPTSIAFQLECGTGTPVKFALGTYAGATTPINSSQNAGTFVPATRTWFTSPATIPSNCTQAELFWQVVPAGTAGANDFFQLDSVQLEIVATANATPTTFQGLDFNTQLRLAQRHYQKTFAYGTAPAQNVGVNSNELKQLVGVSGAGFEWVIWRFPVSMRVTPTTTTTYNPAAANAQVRNESTPADMSGTTVNNSSPDSVVISATGNAGGFTGDLLGVHITADSGI
jgi:hypothetical protein